ncbi:MAG: NeuD/PglB/VioB family sugar acetyltransferase [Chloroflexi bacterium]|nr:NeuD/PglB/VioB family sugar acetyltransferase [Chloroflexota bacterium]
MSAAIAVTIPLINPNENEARLVAYHTKPGQKVKAGALLATLETTKSTFELTAGKAGYLVGVTAQPGELIKAGATLCYLAESKDWKPPKKEKQTKAVGLPDGLRITQPALQLAQKEKLDLSTLPIGPIITEQQVRAVVAKGSRRENLPVPTIAKEPNSVIVYGAGGHGKAVIDLLRAAGGYTLIGVIDDGRQPGDRVLDSNVLGGENALAAIRAAGCKLALNAVGGIGAMSSRMLIFDKLRNAGFEFPVLIHPSAVVEPNAELGAGAQVFPHAYIGSSARLGIGCIVNTSAVVSHDCVLADYVNLAPGAILAGAVSIGEGTLIGMGATINLNVRIGAGARVGNGATIKGDVPAGGIVRAGAIWPN